MKEQLIKDLVSYPFLRRSNWQLKVSVLKNMSVVVVGNHLMFIDKFFVKHFTSMDKAADYIEFIIIKDELNGGY
jgi:hypothetical protein